MLNSKYKLISKSNYFIDDLLEVVCRNRGIEDINFIKNPTDKYNGHYSQLVNMDKALKVFDAFIQTGEILDIGVIQDADNDGMTSAAMLVMYLEKNFPMIKIHLFFHSEKQHGITNEIMEQINNIENLDILFVPDAGSSDFEQHKELYKRGIPVIALDHHSTERLSEHAIIVNNQTSPDYENKQLSGAGIVYRFLECLDDHYGFNDASNYEDLMACGIIGDSMEISQKENLYLISKGLKNIQNPLLKEMIFKHIGKWEKVNPQTLAFNLIPKINATIRVGSAEDKETLFYAMIGREELSVNSRTGKEETLPQKANRLATNAHAKQNRLKKKWIATLKERVEETGADKHPIIVVTLDEKDKFESALSGVIASSLVNIYSRPAIIMRHNSKLGHYSGSMRGDESKIADLKTFLEELKVFDWVQGHANAAGVQIKEENLEILGQLQDKMVEQFTADSSDSLIPVDFTISAKNMRGGIVDEVHKFEKYWGKGIEKPLFCISDLKIDMNDIKVSSGGMISLEINGVSYVQFSASKEWIDLAGTNKIVTFDAIGGLGISSFMGKEKRQMIMDYYSIKNVEESAKKKVMFEF